MVVIQLRLWKHPRRGRGARLSGAVFPRCLPLGTQLWRCVHRDQSPVIILSLLIPRKCHVEMGLEACNLLFGSNLHCFLISPKDIVKHRRQWKVP